MCVAMCVCLGFEACLLEVVGNWYSCRCGCFVICVGGFLVGETCVCSFVLKAIGQATSPTACKA